MLLTVVIERPSSPDIRVEFTDADKAFDFAATYTICGNNLTGTKRAWAIQGTLHLHKTFVEWMDESTIGECHFAVSYSPTMSVIIYAGVLVGYDIFHKRGFIRMKPEDVYLLGIWSPR